MFDVSVWAYAWPCECLGRQRFPRHSEMKISSHAFEQHQECEGHCCL